MGERDDSFFRYLCEHLGFIQIATDERGCISFWNEQAERQFGRKSAEMIGQPLVDVLIPAEREQASARIMAALQQGEPSELEVKLDHPQRGWRTLILIISPIEDETGRRIGVSASMRDISERKRLSQELAKSRRIGSLGHMAAGVAHHFNNILGGMMAGIDSALTTDNPRELRRTLRSVAQAIARATRITRQLETFAESENRFGEEAAPLDRILMTYVEKLRPAGERMQIRIDAKLAPLNPPREFDAHKIQPIVESLVQNALDAMPEGGTVTIELAQEADQAVLRIGDTGVGMPEEVLDRIFEPFFTTKGELGGGTAKNIGLGLAAVHGLVSELDGTIRIDSKVGSGTTVTVRLPLTSREQRTPVGAGAGSTASGG